MHKTAFGLNTNGSSNPEELHRLLTGSVMLRRKKADVLKELPAKIISVVPMEIVNRTEYNKANNDFIDYIRRTRGVEAAERASRAEQLGKVEALKQIAIQGKIKAVINWIRTTLEVQNKLVVFAWHTNIIDKILAEFPNISVRYDGTVSETKKEEAKEAFQNDQKIELFVGNIKAAGLGLTLTAASQVAFVELPWTPSDLDQCSDRLHRIGQKDVVNVHYLIAEDTVEERIANIIDQKRVVIDAIIDGKTTEKFDLLTELINSYIEDTEYNQ